MKYYLFICLLYLFFGCASQGYPTGGPIDNTGPEVLKIYPENQTRLLPEDKIIISFNELINPITIVNAIQIFPENNFSYKISGKKIIISPENKWIDSNILKIKLSRYISDYQNNLMSSPIELFYFNSFNKPNNLISGKIIDGDNQLFELGLYKLNNSQYQLIETTQSNKDNLFEFKYLDKGKYFIIAISDSLVNINDDIRMRNYGMITDQFIDLINNDTLYTNIKIDSPIEKLSIQSFNQINNKFGYVIYDNGFSDPFIIKEYSDSILINMQLNNRLESYLTDNYYAALTNIIDTIPPNVRSTNCLDQICDIIFNEPINYLDSLYKPSFFYLQDSIYYNLDYSLINSFTIRIPIQNKLISKILISNLSDLYNNNNNDTLSVLVNPSHSLNNNVSGGNVYGSIVYNGNYQIIIKAKSINDNYTYYTFLNEDNKFSIMNIQPGFYTFSAFEFFGGYDSTQYFSGLWDPISRAAKFSVYSNNLEIRKHWDVKDMIMEIK